MIFWDTYRMFKGDRYFPATSILLPEEDDDFLLEESEKKAVNRLRLAQSLLSGTKDAVLAGIPLQDADLWTEVPLLITHTTTARIYPALLGRLPTPTIVIEPGWLFPDAEEAARNALRIAGQGKRGFILLRGTIGPQTGIQGGSLALPLAVAGHRLCAGQTLPANIMLTGALDPEGKIVAVDGIPAKRNRVFAYTSERLFFYPLANKEELAGTKTNAIPVVTLAAAYSMCELSEEPALLDKLDLWRQSPHYFFDALRHFEIPPNALAPLISIAESDHWEQNLTEIEAIASALSTLWSIRNDGSEEHSALRKTVTELLDRVFTLFPEDPASPLFQSLPTSAQYQLASMHQTFETQKGHSGDTIWKEICAKITEHDKTTLETRQSSIESYIRSTLLVQQNKYHFVQEQDPEWMADVTKMAELLQYLGIQQNETLGKAFGALSQAKAYAGLYDEALAYNQRSIEFNDSSENQKRRAIEAIYILCESGQTARAIEVLRHFSTAPEVADKQPESLAHLVAHQDDPFLHAAFLRLCRQADLFADYPLTTVLHNLYKPDHPWQLWACNAGYLVAEQNKSLAHTLFMHSLTICLAQEEAWTLIPMALRPLAGLMHFALERTDVLEQKTEEVRASIRKACANNYLDAEHFASLLQATNGLEALALVAKEEKSLFPFDFR